MTPPFNSPSFFAASLIASKAARRAMGVKPSRGISPFGSILNDEADQDVPKGEPLWKSIAKAAAGSFVAAFATTAGSEVARRACQALDKRTEREGDPEEGNKAEEVENTETESGEEL